MTWRIERNGDRWVASQPGYHSIYHSSLTRLRKLATRRASSRNCRNCEYFKVWSNYGSEEHDCTKERLPQDEYDGENARWCKAFEWYRPFPDA